MTSKTLEVGTGRFGFCTLTWESFKVEAEVFVVAQEGEWSIVVAPVVGIASDSEWSLGATAAGAASSSPGATAVTQVSLPPGPELRLEVGLTVRILKVDGHAVRRLAQTRNVAVAFASRPKPESVLSAFYQSEYAKPDQRQQVPASSTDDGGKSRRLEEENRRLSREVDRLRVRRSSPSRRGAREADKYQIGSDADAASGGSEDGSLSEAFTEEEPDALVRRMKKFVYAPQNSFASARSQDAAPLPARSGESEQRRGGRPGAEADEGQHRGDSRHQRGARQARIDAGTTHRSERTGREERELIALEVQMKTLELLKELREAPRGTVMDAPENGELDGLRAARSLGRVRMLRENMEGNPERTSREYKELWVSRVGAQGKPFKWTDRNKWIKWGKWQSMRRVDWMFCNILETMDEGKPELARAQLIQCMKTLHEFSNHGSWKASWPYTHMEDPISRMCHGATEVEVEAVTGMLKTRDDLKSRVHRSMKELVSEGEDDDPAGTDHHPAAKAQAKPKAKK